MSTHGKYRVNEYISFLRKNGLAVNNLFAIKINPPSIIKSAMERTGEATGFDFNGEESITSGNRLEGIINTKKYTTKGLSLADSALGSFGLLRGNNGNNTLNNRLNDLNKVLAPNIGTDQQIIEMLCTSAQLPFYKAKMGDAFYNHYKHKFVTGQDTDAIPLTFYIDRKDLLVLNFFMNWHKMIYESVGGQVGWMNYKKNYEAEIEIVLLNKTQNGEFDEFFSAKLIGAFPSAIDPINLTCGATELIQLKVNIEFDRIEHDPKPNRKIEDQNDLNLTGAELRKLSLIDQRNFANQAMSVAKDIASNVIYDAKSVIANVHEAKNSVKSMIDAHKVLPKTIKTEANDIVGNAKKSLKF